MKFRQGVTLAHGDVAAGIAFALGGAFVMYEGIKLGSGWGESGPDAGFFPFYLALLMMIGGAVSAVQAWRSSVEQPFFEDRVEIVELARVGIPMAVAILTIPILGLYLMTAIYIALFAWWYGSFRWHMSVLAGVLTAASLYLVLTRGFRLPMPQSMWYGTLPF
jgi:hypothetical protein